MRIKAEEKDEKCEDTNSWTEEEEEEEEEEEKEEE